MADMDIEELKQQYFENGYFVVVDAVDPAMIDPLEAAAVRVVDKVRSGRVDLSGLGPEATAVYGIIAPEFGEPVFGEYLCCGEVLRYVEAFFGPEVRMGHTLLWATEKDYDTGWHRDLGPIVERSEAEEMAILQEPMTMLKWQTALLDDPCLWVVPKSHARYRTERERKVLLERKGDLPGQVQISLKRGQTVFWSHKLIHRGRMPESMDRRLSVAGCLKGYDPNAENDYASER